MHIEIKDYDYKNSIRDFLKRNGLAGIAITETEAGLSLEIDESVYSSAQLSKLRRHFSYYDIFSWSSRGIENTILWEKPERVQAVVKEFQQMFNDIEYDIVTSVEARGFILGGLFAAILKKPFLAVRKFKPIYQQLPGWRQHYKNWKGEAESLYLFQNPFIGQKAVLVDDLIQTGNSLRAARRLLAKSQIELTGAFYLSNVAKPEVIGSFNFPIKTLLTYCNWNI
jgi:adenine/guanine phosphoribosyltransferase-like PRPP-binding protein